MAARKTKARGRPKLKLAGDIVEDARLALAAGCRMTDLNVQATAVLFALGRALKRQDAGALGGMASAARQALEAMREPTGDALAHRRHVVHTMGEMLAHQREAVARNDPRRPPPLPARHMAQALARMLASGPMRDLYESRRSEQDDGDVERILGAWSDHVAGDGVIHAGEDHGALARKLVVSALVSLGIPRKTALAGLVRKAPGKSKAPSRFRR
jgi:hypothetical protein